MSVAESMANTWYRIGFAAHPHPEPHWTMSVLVFASNSCTRKTRHSTTLGFDTFSQMCAHFRTMDEDQNGNSVKDGAFFGDLKGVLADS